MRPSSSLQPGSLSGILGLAGIGVVLAGFGLLLFDAAIGVIAIPAGIALAVAGRLTASRR